jgi:hypothetical protein
VNVARWFRWFPIAFGFKNEPTTVEQLRAVQKVDRIVPAPTRTHERDRQKLRIYPRMRVMRKKAGAA